MITKLPEVYIEHDPGQDPLKGGVRIVRFKEVIEPYYHCEIHGYHIVRGYTDPCAHVKAVMECVKEKEATP